MSNIEQEAQLAANKAYPVREANTNAEEVRIIGKRKAFSKGYLAHAAKSGDEVEMLKEELNEAVAELRACKADHGYFD